MGYSSTEGKSSRLWGPRRNLLLANVIHNYLTLWFWGLLVSGIMAWVVLAAVVRDGLGDGNSADWNPRGRGAEGTGEVIVSRQGL